MLDPSEIALALLAVLIHLFFGYLLQYKPTRANIKELNNTSAQDVLPIFRQEFMAFIFFPILGYATLIFLTYQGFGIYDGFRFSIQLLIIQIISFVSYFQSRKLKHTSRLYISTLRASVMILGNLSCLALIISLFCYYIICITIGWMFIILPFCMLAYYALFQVIAFQTAELIKILKIIKEKRTEYLNDPSAITNEADSFVIKHSTFISPYTISLLLILFLAIYHFNYISYLIWSLTN